MLVTESLAGLDIGGAVVWGATAFVSLYLLITVRTLRILFGTISVVLIALGVGVQTGLIDIPGPTSNISRAFLAASSIPMLFAILLAVQYRNKSNIQGQQLAALNADNSRKSFLLTQAIEGLSEGLVIMDARKTVLYANRAARRYIDIGLFRDKFLEAARYVDPHTGAMLPKSKRPSTLALSGMTVLEEELLLALPNSEREVRLLESAVPLHAEDGKVDGAILWFRDITDERDLERRNRDIEQQLAQAQKLEAVGQLAGGIAHDFNNLLQVIMGNIDFLLEGKEADTSPDTRFLKQIKMAGDRGSQLTRRLLAFSKGQPDNPVSVDLNDLIQGVTPLLERTLGGKVKIDEILADGLGNTVIDPNAFENALLNLAVNARDAMPGGGILSITSRAVAVEEGGAETMPGLAPGRYIVLEVRDTGVGMSPEVRQHIFEPFYTTKAHDAGSGLGLAMVYSFVQRSGGTIRVDSEPGRGTVFTMWLPEVEAAAKPAAQSSVVAAMRKGEETVLVVDDDDDVRNMIVQMVESIGYKVYSKDNAVEGLLFLQRHPEVEILLTDVVMPGAYNGLQFADRAIKAKPDLRVVITTGYAEKFDKELSGMGDHASVLLKPFTKDDLAATVARQTPRAQAQVA
ncbi:ATP-binding protein [Emcibacter sp. SYSU 3D8]|uniref:ATP-binding protein n=1 Tax=Emcibacter sp. SYSU 3D8 TaxID=3133969 RepID=UPI0031FE9603